MSSNSTQEIERSHAITQILRCVGLLSNEDIAQLLYELYGKYRCHNYHVTDNEEQEEL